MLVTTVIDADLVELSRPFPTDFVERKDGQDYVAHHVVNQRLLSIVGPFDFELVQVIRGDVAAMPPDPSARSRRGKAGTPALQNVVVGGIWRLTCAIDGRQVRVEEVGEPLGQPGSAQDLGDGVHLVGLQPQHAQRPVGIPPVVDRDLLAKAGAEVTAVGGCCGLAGNFGAERGHYDVSVAVAETALLPAVRAASPDAVLLADGFSCRTQLDHLTGRHALHLAELLAQAATPGGAGP